MKLTCICTVYNEESRIVNFLSHATKWADEVIIRDKQSTDRTVEICNSYGVEVIPVPFTDSAHFDPSFIDPASNEWVFLMTASETPTRNLIHQINKLLDERSHELDLVAVPKRLWSFGIHSKQSPWGVSYQPFLMRKGGVIMSAEIHRNFSHAEGRGATIPFDDLTFVDHATHATAEKFLKQHMEYALAEVNSDESTDSINQRCANALLGAFEGVNPGHELWSQRCGWNVYFWSILLLASERCKDHRPLYESISRSIIATDWSD
jgi:hypothetical protein